MAFDGIAQRLAEVNPLLAEQMQQNPWIFPMILFQIILKAVFYPIALYHSAKRGRKAWFIALFICLFFLNDFGLLPVLYLVFNRDKKPLKSAKKKR